MDLRRRSLLAQSLAAHRNALHREVEMDKQLADALRRCTHRGRIVRALPSGVFMPGIKTR